MGKLTNRIFNASNVFGAISLLAMIAIPGAMEGERYIAVVVLIAVFTGCAHLAIKEDGRIKLRRT